MNLFDVLEECAISCCDAAPDKDSLLRRIAELAARCSQLGGSSSEEVYAALKDREALGSTGFGDGIAIPHCRLAGIDRFIAGFVTVPGGLDFDSLDGRKAYLFPFVIGPEARPKEHLSLLSHISQSLRDRELRESLLRARTPADIMHLLKEEVGAHPAELPHRPGMKMLHLFVRNEKLFSELLQIFAVETVSAVVLDVHESTEYVSKLPFFAGFWNTDTHRFNRMIVAVIRNELVNSTVRSIEYVCDRLTGRDDVMLTVTDLHYVLGSLTGQA